MKDEILPPELAEAVDKVWDEAWDDLPGPDALWGVRFVMVSSGDEDDHRSVFAPMTFPSREQAASMLDVITSSDGPAIVMTWVNLGWLVLPDEDNAWMPLSAQLAKLAPIPF